MHSLIIFLSFFRCNIITIQVQCTLYTVQIIMRNSVQFIRQRFLNTHHAWLTFGLIIKTYCVAATFCRLKPNNIYECVHCKQHTHTNNQCVKALCTTTHTALCLQACLENTYEIKRKREKKLRNQLILLKMRLNIVNFLIDLSVFSNFVPPMFLFIFILFSTVKLLVQQSKRKYFFIQNDDGKRQRFNES